MAPYHDWRSSVEAAPPGSTVSFSPGVYRGCNVTLRTGECVGDTLPQLLCSTPLTQDVYRGGLLQTDPQKRMQP